MDVYISKKVCTTAEAVNILQVLIWVSKHETFFIERQVLISLIFA